MLHAIALAMEALACVSGGRISVGDPPDPFFTPVLLVYESHAPVLLSKSFDVRIAVLDVYAGCFPRTNHQDQRKCPMLSVCKLQ